MCEKKGTPTYYIYISKSLKVKLRERKPIDAISNPREGVQGVLAHCLFVVHTFFFFADVILKLSLLTNKVS